MFLTVGADPVEIGLVASLNRPGGNLTGAASLITAVLAKRLELLHELVPAATSIALLANPANPVLVEAETRELQAAARILGVQLVGPAGKQLKRDRGGLRNPCRAAGGRASWSAAMPTLPAKVSRLVALAARHAVPAIYQWREYTAAGGLMSYGSAKTDGVASVGVYTGRILKGEKPADLPVQQATKIELVINMKTAKALGITFPDRSAGSATPMR